MSSLIEQVATELRRRILVGELEPGQRIRELEFAPELGVSRTPLRLALGELETEGLVERVGKRGFQVRRVTLDEVSEAVEVRGVLEGLAARRIAETGLSAQTHDGLLHCIAEGRAILAAVSQGNALVDTARWAEMNARFHRILIEAAASDVLRMTLDYVMKMPLAAAGALGLSGAHPALAVSFLERAQGDHEDILGALVLREGSRVEALMREHARRSRDNKRALAQHIGLLSRYGNAE